MCLYLLYATPLYITLLYATLFCSVLLCFALEYYSALLLAKAQPIQTQEPQLKLLYPSRSALDFQSTLYYSYSYSYS